MTDKEEIEGRSNLQKLEKEIAKLKSKALIDLKVYQGDMTSATVESVAGELLDMLKAIEEGLTTPLVFNDSKRPKECSLCADPNYQPEHNGSSMCQSGSIASGGKRPHCTCDICF